MLSNWFIRTLLLVILMVTSPAYADSTASNSSTSAPTSTTGDLPAGGSFFANLSDAVSNVITNTTAAVNLNLFNAGLKVASQSKPFALGLGGSLATVYLIVEAFSIMSTKNGSLRQLLVDIALPVALCSYLLINYEQQIQNFTGSGGLMDSVRNIGGSSTGDVMKMYGSLLDLIWNAIKSGWDAVEIAYKNTSGAINTLAAVLIGLCDLIATLLFSFLMIGLCLTGLTEILGLILMGPFLTAIGVAFGPIFIALLVTPWTRDYFGRWLGFIVGAAVLTGVLNVCVGIATTVFGSLGFSNIAGNTAPNASMLLVAAIIVMSVNSLIQQAPAIASALVPGSIGASKGTANAIDDYAKNVSAKSKSAGRQVKNNLGSIRDKAAALIAKRMKPPVP